jgi:hypothetical protein
MLSRLMTAIPAAAKYSVSLVKLHVLNARPRSRGQHWAIRQICRRTRSLIVFGLPPAPFWVQRREPGLVERVNHPRTYSAERTRPGPRPSPSPSPHALHP